MPRRGVKSTKPAVSVKGEDARASGSISITIYPGTDRLDDVMRYIQTMCERRWTTTKITDRRHKRR